jgi:hypothetical protein
VCVCLLLCIRSLLNKSRVAMGPFRADGQRRSSLCCGGRPCFKTDPGPLGFTTGDPASQCSSSARFKRKTTRGEQREDWEESHQAESSPVYQQNPTDIRFSVLLEECSFFISLALV